jgi:response regulator RpfG family c-di-GMP phosphodiesterase
MAFEEEGRMTQPLSGVSVLIVEDEIIIGMMLRDEITQAGGIAIGPVTSVADALKELGSQVVDTVVLDAKLVDGSGAELAARLDERQIPFLVTSGYEAANLPRELRSAPFVAKPVSVPLLVEALESLAAPPKRHLPIRRVADSDAIPNRSPDQRRLEPGAQHAQKGQAIFGK